ncbi:S9 family peptidase [Erythrobacteraceae bacterium CFH 75059]|uniref:S9 family peptidase n=1 Tax=Qipengyuania thermophila TaxID=2509361 RepID=UPI0010226717|nr:DPP IV N-terminal domain-containing protein [Qipengyuania thermophila]TCD05381.1 S9 family peptidase [Erythrobacteraceae bacterium CFH 75059]
MRTFTALAAAIALATPLAAGAQPVSAPQTQDAAPPLTFERVFASPSLDGPAPRAAQLSPDGRYLTLLRNREDDRERFDLWGYDRETGEWAMLVDSLKLGTGRELSEAEKMQRERARIGNLRGIVSYQWNADGQSLLVPLDGDLFLARLGGEITRLTDTPESELNPKLSPSGGFVSFAREGRLWVGAVGSEPQPVTPPDSSDTVRWGEAEFVAQEEMKRLTGYWWAPGDRRIAVQRFDESGVGIVTRAAIGATGTRVFEQRYPVAGSPNALVQLFVIDPDGGNRVEVDLGPNSDIYLARVDWAPDGQTLYVQRQDRAQTRLDVLAVDPATGSSRVLFTERAASRHWINLSDDYRWLDDGSLVWWSERDGYGHLYHRRGSEWVQLTRGEWVVTKLVGVDQQAGRVFFTGTRDDVLAQQLYSVDLTRPGEVTLLSDPAFAHAASMDQRGQTLFITRSNDTQPPQSYLADAAGQRLAWIEENAVNAAHPYAPYLSRHRPAQYGTLQAEDGQTLYWEMVTPQLEPGKRYPVFFYHYGGPGVQVVGRGWDNPLRQAIVQRGYIWFALDNRGSANRGVAFEQPLYRALGTVEVRDQKRGAEYLKTLPFVDPDKIAIDGWSYGGYLTLLQLQADPGLYAAGISGAPVTKWELYDTHYTERFMGTPQSDPDAYRIGSAIPRAAAVTDPLLLIHGMADDNVVFEHATEIIAVMQNANVPFDMMLYPGLTHRVAGPTLSPHRYNTVFRFLEANGVTPPE